MEAVFCMSIEGGKEMAFSMICLPAEKQPHVVVPILCLCFCRFGFYKYMKIDQPERRNPESEEKTEQPGKDQ